MPGESNKVGYKIWGVDNAIYGPVELPGLVDWIKDHRVTSSTWVYCEADDSWRKASAIPELKMFFGSRLPASPTRTLALEGITTGELRRVKAFSDLTEDQLSRFVDFMEVQNVRQWTQVVRQGEHGDAMFLVLEGELRARLLIDGKESTLVTLGPGDFFGEISLFDQGPRSADVLANVDSVVLKISSAAFSGLVKNAPDVAAQFLMSVSKTLTARIRADNKRYRDSVIIGRATS
jgi:Cyclic nucleotide-binding domain/GYF domain 2